MITVKKLIEILQTYNSESEVILPDGKEIKLIRNVHVPSKGSCIVLANGKNDDICCSTCSGDLVYLDKNKYYCPHCDKTYALKQTYSLKCLKNS